MKKYSYRVDEKKKHNYVCDYVFHSKLTSTKQFLKNHGAFFK